jgi:hypothetical protein
MKKRVAEFFEATPIVFRICNFGPLGLSKQ